MSAFDKIYELKKQLQDSIQEEGGKILQQEIKKSLDLMPEIESIAWVQNHSVYNDETNEFSSSPFVAIPKQDCPWREQFNIEISHIYGNHESEDNIDNPLYWDEFPYALNRVSKKLPDQSERLGLILKVLKDLGEIVPEEVLKTFGDVAVHITRDGISFIKFHDYGC